VDGIEIHPNMEKTKEFIRSNYSTLERSELRKLLACLGDDDFWEIVGDPSVPRPVSQSNVYYCILMSSRGAYDKIMVFNPVERALNPGLSERVVSFSVNGKKPEKGTFVWMAVRLAEESTFTHLSFPVFSTPEEALSHLEKQGLLDSLQFLAHEGVRRALLEGHTFKREWVICKLKLP
jgi:hypothetical protein